MKVLSNSKKIILVSLFGKSKNTIFVWLFCLGLSLLFLLVCTKSSPLYPINDWNDANAFFTMGKGMINGKVLYRDLFEQKGPFLYLIYAIGYLITDHSFFGIYLLEAFSFSFFLLFCFKSLSLFGESKIAFICLPLLSVSILNLKSMAHGGSAEEFCLPFMSFSLFWLLNIIKNNDWNNGKANVLFWNGAVAGVVFWIKFTICGFWLGWLLSVCVFIITNKLYSQLIKALGFFLIGLLAVTIPWLIYFGINNSFFDWINTYIIINITKYSDYYSIPYRVFIAFAGIISQIRFDPIVGSLLWLGVIIAICFPKFIHEKIYRFCLALTIVLLILGIYGGGKGFIYLSLITTPLLIFFFILATDLFHKYFYIVASKKTSILVLCISLTIISLIFTLESNQNSYFMKIKKNELVQYKFAQLINQTQNPTLLNYGSLDMGFYFTTGILPSVKYFENQNIDYARFPIIMDEQNRYIEEKLIDYVVLSLPSNELSKIKERSNYLFENYTLIGEDKQFVDQSEKYFYLFRKIP